MAQLELHDLTVFYPGQETPALRGVTASLEAGEFVTLCGRSGSGKSTLLRCCKPALAPQGTRRGEIFWAGRPLSGLSDRAQSASIGYVGQSPENQMVTDRVWQELAFGPENLGWDPAVIRRRVAEMASFFGIQTWFHREISTLSGGQRQLLALAAVMVLEPALLLLDEPTSQLDPIAAGDFLEMVQRINRELGTTILLAEHRLAEAVPRSDRLLVLEGGQLLCQGTPREVGAWLRRQNHPLAAALPAPMEIWARVSQSGPCPVTVGEGQIWLAEYARSHPLGDLPPVCLPSPGETLLQAESLWFRYDRNGPDVVKDFSLSVGRGELLALLGGNGTGKTTVLHLLAGLRAPQRGRLRRQGRVAMLPQNLQTLFWKKTLREDLLDQTARMDLPPAEGAAAVAEIAALCGLEGLLDRHPYDLSGGEQRRAALAKVLLTRPEVLLLDEPTKGLDWRWQEELAALLQRLLSQGAAVILVSHDLEFCARHAHRCALFFDGAVVAQDQPRAFFSGNRFYTTATNRMVRAYLPQGITPEEVISACGGEPSGERKPLARPPENQAAPEEAGEPREPAAIPAPPRDRAPRRKLTVVGVPLVLGALTLLAGELLFQGKQYHWISLLLLMEGLLPSFFWFEQRRPGARELVLLACLCGLGVAGRGAFFWAPQCKPVTALTILTGVSLGGQAGFLVGAVTMLVSNLFFGQGPWTPWQMFAMGCIGGLAGSLFSRRGRRSQEGDAVPVWLFGGCGALWGRDEHRLRTALVPFPPVGADRGRLRGGSAHGFAPRGEHSPAPVPAGRPGARQAGPDAGEVWMGPRVNGEWAMETKTDHRPDMRSVVCLFGRGAIPGRSPQRGSSDRRSQGK